jgi:hypothetical protein
MAASTDRRPRGIFRRLPRRATLKIQQLREDGERDGARDHLGTVLTAMIQNSCFV